MEECQFYNYKSYDDIQLFEVGLQTCPPGHRCGPIIRKNYLMHYIFHGSGEFTINNELFTAKAGQAFILPPDILVYHQADEDDPWEYIWVHFNGRKAKELLEKAGITEHTPVFVPSEPADEIGEYLLSILHHSDKEIDCIANLYHIFQVLIDKNIYGLESALTVKIVRYVNKVCEYIALKYPQTIKIQDIADCCGLNRAYLSRIFRQATNYSMQEYLLNYRIGKAKELLSLPNIQIRDVAYSVGYSDPYAFSKIFKKVTGFAPKDFRSGKIS